MGSLLRAELLAGPCPLPSAHHVVIAGEDLPYTWSSRVLRERNHFAVETL